MSNPFQKEYELIINALEDAYEEVDLGVRNPQVYATKNRVLQSMQRNINFLRLLSNNPAGVGVSSVLEYQMTPQVQPPLTKMFGKQFSNIKPVPQDIKPEEFKRISEQTSADVETIELQAKLDQLYPDFINIDSAAIFDTYTDIEIRAVAKRAGLPVTENFPKKADVKFIEQVKKAIKEQNELLSKKDAALTKTEPIVPEGEKK